jgi:nucleoid-associated protein YgaU
MNQFSKKALYLVFFMIAAVGVQSFADTVEDARTALSSAEAAYAEAEAALTAAKTAAESAGTSLEDARAAFVSAETALTEAKATLAAAEASEASANTGVVPVREGVADAGQQPPAREGVADASQQPPAREGVADADEVVDASQPPIRESVTTPVPTGEEVAEAEEVPAVTEQEIPENIRNNEYFLESQRLLALSREAYDAGDYDAATEYAEEAARFARLSDEYIAQQTGRGDAEQKDERTADILPATYTVRKWDIYGDCFWNIAGRPWVYNDPHRWRTLYEANRSKLDNPNNPNIIEPGTVLDIPSIKGETRQGEWDSNRTYEPLR